MRSNDEGMIYLNKRCKKIMLICLSFILLSIILVHFIGHSAFNHPVEARYASIMNLIPVDKHASLQMLQPGRSELFPVVSFESSPQWQVICWAGDEIFLLRMNDVETARDTFSRSIDEYWKSSGSDLGHIAQYDEFILLYRGDRTNILHWLASMTDSCHGSMGTVDIALVDKEH